MNVGEKQVWLDLIEKRAKQLTREIQSACSQPPVFTGESQFTCPCCGKPVEVDSDIAIYIFESSECPACGWHWSDTF